MRLLRDRQLQQVGGLSSVQSHWFKAFDNVTNMEIFLSINKHSKCESMDVVCVCVCVL